MKKLYHLLVTSNKLRVTNLFCRISDIGYRISFIAFCFLPAAAFAQNEATITNLDFSCPGIVTVTYDLDVSRCVNVTLEYSSENCGWMPALGAEGDLTSQTTGDGKTITWDAAAHNVSFGKFYYKVTYPSAPSCVELNGVTVNGLCWAKTNLDVGGVFCTNPWDYGALYQWGRRPDGHERRTPNPPYLSGPVPDSNLDGNGQPTGSYTGAFITNSGTGNWRSQCDTLWNYGSEICPIKSFNDPCPDGWRVPVLDEFNNLITTIINGSGSLATYTGVAGRWFGDGGVSSLFLPAAGYRWFTSGSVLNAGTIGRYYTSTPFTAGSTSRLLYFESGSYTMSMNSSLSAGSSVRCVAEQ